MKNIHILPTDKPSRIAYYGKELKYSKTKPVQLFTTTLDWKLQNIYITSDEEIKEGDAYITKHGEICKSHNGSKILLFKTDKKIIITTDHDLIKNGVQAIDDEFLEWFVNNPSCESVEVIYGLYNPMGRKVSSEKVSENHSQCVWKYKIIIPKEENKVLVEMQQTLKKDSKIMGHYESCDLCHYNAFFKYLYNGEILYRCQGHKIVDINNLKSKFGFGDEEPKQETIEEAAEKEYPKQGEDSTYCDLGLIQQDAFINGAKWQSERSYSEEDMFEFSQWISHEDWVYLPSKGYWVNEEQEELEQKLSSKEILNLWFEQFKNK
jgi:hypothetical protein